MGENRTKTIHRQTADRTSATWLYPTVPVTEYRTDASAGISKQVLIGNAEGASDFLIRYFTMPPGARSALDRHAHEHGVVVLDGNGRVLLGEEWHEIQTGDTVFTSADEQHQFEAIGSGPLGFICVIPT